MPIQYICKKCGRLLYEITSKNPSYSIPTPKDIVECFKKCPVCGEELKLNDDVEIYVDTSKWSTQKNRGRKVTLP